MTTDKRKDSLIVNGVPKYIRCYDNTGTNNETLDCITVVFSKKRIDRQFLHLGSSTTGTGILVHGSTEQPIDFPSYGHLGKKIKFSDLTPKLQKIVMSDYCDLWGLK